MAITLQDVNVVFQIWKSRDEKFQQLIDVNRALEHDLPVPGSFESTADLEKYRLDLADYKVARADAKERMENALKDLREAQAALDKILEFWGVWYRVTGGYVMKESNGTYYPKFKFVTTERMAEMQKGN